eukprot:TRINITY_DN12779_c0_g2_i1.p1 TRINITY_DN12779_c0_g2~~TRINITY_DN12779_c0_g2_i1.p1  ORF type:complete len:120 (+),score=30.99 TRINITY_DN12779_c0_g2_i1:154-513(+)
MGLKMVSIIQSFPPIEGLSVNVRIGIHSGTVVGGIIGVSKMVFDIWGENVNIASKMESNGTPGCVNISHVTKQLIEGKPEFRTDDRAKSIHYGSKEINMFYVTPGSDAAVPPSAAGQDW